MTLNMTNKNTKVCELEHEETKLQIVPSEIKTKVDSSLYNTITKLIDEAVQQVMIYENKKHAESPLAQARETAYELLSKYSEKTKYELQDLKSTSEWDCFTLAFYGETNAGKSTLIETLRLILGESQKKESQQKFHQLAQEISISPEDVQKIESLIKQHTITRNEKMQELEHLQNKISSIERSNVQNIEQFRLQIAKKKELLPWWSKLWLFIVKLEEESQLFQRKKEFAHLQEEHRETLSKKEKELQLLHQALADQQAAMKKLEKTYEALMPLQDGIIIGDGRSDFTLVNQIYTFTVDGQKFQIIDIPGIEGNEKKVNTAIDSAIKKAHAVFYVTRKAVPPGSGSDGQEGTIDKIKRQLGKQTEVWAIYNKSITNPLALQGDELINDGERESIKAMEDSLKESLSDAYQRCMILSAMPAFYAHSVCLLPINHNYKNRQKFLATMNEQELLHRSGLVNFVQFIKNEISQNYKNKIEKSNLKKIRGCLDDGLDFLRKASQTIFKAVEIMQPQVVSTNSQLDSLLESTDKRLKSVIRDRLAEKKSEIRDQIYEYVSQDVSNDEFKVCVEGKIELLKNDIGPMIGNKLQSELNSFNAVIEKIIKNHQENLDDILKYHINDKFSQFDHDFQFDFKINNGINVAGLISSFGGAAILVWTAFLASNPVGWVAATILGAVGLVFSFYKAVRSFFSSEYKKEQQRKSTDSNLQNIFDAIEEKLIDSVNEACTELNLEIAKLKTTLHTSIITSQRTIESLNLTMKQVAKLRGKLI